MSTSELSLEQVDYTDLLAWLQVATEGLSTDARARVRQEITDHFHQALDDGLHAGLAAHAAAQKAVEDLGSPEAARRAFRRTCLTHWQAYLLRRLIDPPKSAISSTSLFLPPALPSLWDPNRERRARPLLAILLTALTAVATALDPSVSWLNIGLLALMTVAAIALAAAVPRLVQRSRERSAVVLGATAELSLWGAFLVAPAINRTETLEPRLWIVGFFAVITAVSYLPLLHKLRERRGTS